MNKKELKNYFKNDLSGSRHRLSHILKIPGLFEEIQEWSKNNNLVELSFIERVYCYVHDIKKLQIDKSNGLYKKFISFSKGYTKKGRLYSPFYERKKLSDLKVSQEYQDRGGSISQIISNDDDLLCEINQKFPFNISKRAKIYMFVNELNEVPLCSVCENKTKFGASKAFNKTCSEKCRRISEQKKRSETIDFFGRRVRVQGYEKYVITDLVKSGISPDNILVSDEITHFLKCPIKYELGDYYPDIYLKKENKIIEVKSDFTYKFDLEKSLKKKEGSINAGFNFEFCIYEEPRRKKRKNKQK